MIARPCHRCGNPIPTGTYCTPCRPNDKATRTRHDAHLNRTRWKKLSKRLRAMQPYCSHCGATEDLTVDHITPLALRPDLAYTPSNLDVLCRSCNGAKDATLGRRTKTPGQPSHVKAQRALLLTMIPIKDGGDAA